MAESRVNHRQVTGLAVQTEVPPIKLISLNSLNLNSALIRKLSFLEVGRER